MTPDWGGEMMKGRKRTRGEKILGGVEEMENLQKLRE